MQNPSPFNLSIDMANVATVPPAPSGVVRPLLTELPEAENFLLILDNTAAEKLKRCHAAGGYYLVDRREGHARNAALSFGGAIHEGLEGLLRGESVDQQNQRVLRYFTENPAPPDEYRTPTCALEVLQHYRNRSNVDIYEDYRWDVQSDERGPLIERAFELPLGVLDVNADVQLPQWETPKRVSRIHVAWAGRMDVIATCNGRVRVCDHKTSSIDGDQFVQSFQLSSQTIGYVWAAQQLWPQLDVSGFCLNVIRLKKPTGSASLVEKGPRGGEPALKFFRAYFDYSPERVAEWADDALTFVEDFIHSLVRNRFPLNDRHCFDKFGRCPYHDICTIDDPNVRQRMLLSDMFKDVTWNPTTGRS